MSSNVSPELLKTMDDVAERAAKRAAESVHQEMKYELLEMEKRLENKIGQQIKDSLGVDVKEHYAQHKRIGEFLDSVNGFWSSFMKKTAELTAVFIIGAIAAAYVLKPVAARQSEDYPARTNQVVTSEPHRASTPTPTEPKM